MIRLNPFARVETTRGPLGEIDGLRVVAPVKGRGLQTTSFAREQDPARFSSVRRLLLTALFDAQSGKDPWQAASAADRDLFERSGLFVRDVETPRAVTFEPMDVPQSYCRVTFSEAPPPLDRGFVVAPEVVRGDLLLGLRRYYSALIAEGFATYGGEGGEPHRWVVHNDPAAQRLQSLISLVVGPLAGQPLKPSFTYLLRYLEGASLPAHRDREQCAVTAVLQVDFDPEPVGATPWPLYFKTPAGPHAVFLGFGDLVIFRGTETEHYREPLICGRSSTNLAFCFVPVDYDGPLD